MSTGHRLSRFADVARALREQKGLEAHDGWSRDRLLAYQRERLGELVAYASRRSALYRRLYGGEIAATEVDLERLPPLDKATMMASFDELVTDPRLRREALEGQLEEVEGDDLYLGEYRVIASGGSSGLRGLYVYDRRAWSTLIAGVLRWSRMMGVTPRLPRRRRGLAIGAPDAKHMTFRVAETLDVGLHRMKRLAADEPLERLVAEAAAHQPEFMNAYPSIAAMLAGEQIAGRLGIRPRFVCTSSEVRTPEMTERIRAAWGVEPFNCLGLSETGITAVDCAEHRGMHVFEDTCVFEVVDHAGKPVAPGQPGARVLVTNLFNRTQPLIRFEITDLVTVDHSPCPCGRSSMRITAIEGRSDDVLELPTARGGVAPVHPIHLRSPMSGLPAVSQYQIVHHPDRLEVVLVVQHGAPATDTANAVRHALGERLAELGVAMPIEVQVRDRLQREGAAKLKLVMRAALG